VKKVEAVIRPDRLQSVQDALDALGTSGLTVTEVLGCGAQRGYTETYRGAKVNISLQRKVKVEAIVGDSMVEAVIDAISGAARTGEVGDGKITVLSMGPASARDDFGQPELLAEHPSSERPAPIR